MVDRNPFEAALWFNADIASEKASAKEGIEETFLRTATMHMVRFGPIQWEELKPGDERCPTPPPNMTGNLRLLVGTATPIGELEEVRPITNDFTDEDLRRLRIATRRAYIRAGGQPLTDEECDYFINLHGAEVIGEMIKEGTDK